MDSTSDSKIEGPDILRPPLIRLLPERPIEPLDSECCGTGCTPCVFDIYKKQLAKWEKQCEQIQNGDDGTAESTETQQENNLCPYTYNEFKIINLVKDPDASSVKIFTFSDSAENETRSTGRHVPFAVAIGQHVVIKIGIVSRKYTVLRVNKLNSSFDILVKIYPNGSLTQLLDKVEIGDTVLIRGPFGDPWIYKQNTFKTVVMLAAGTGLAPMYRIIDIILQNEEEDTRVKLIFCNRKLSDIFLRGKLKEWSEFWNFQVVHYLSKDNEEHVVKVPYGMNVCFQRLNFEFLSEQFKTNCELAKTMFYICGTNSFEKDMVNYLSKLGVDEKDVLVF